LAAAAADQAMGGNDKGAASNTGANSPAQIRYQQCRAGCERQRASGSVIGCGSRPYFGDFNQTETAQKQFSWDSCAMSMVNSCIGGCGVSPR